MKILYGAEDRLGANLQLGGLLKTDHDVRVAAYITASDTLPYIDWTLNAAYTRRSDKLGLSKLFRREYVPKIDVPMAKMMLESIAEWQPDLVISDSEPIVAHIAYALEIPLWYCSTMNLTTGINWSGIKSRYGFHTDRYKEHLRTFPEGERYLVSSPFGDIENRPELNHGYEWVKPYCSKLDTFSTTDTNRDSELLKTVVKTLDSKNLTCSTGETSFVSTSFYNKDRIMISASPNNIEGLLNATLCEHYGIGVNFGKIETSFEYAQSKMQIIVEDFEIPAYLNAQTKQLHEIL